MRFVPVETDQSPVAAAPAEKEADSNRRRSRLLIDSLPIRNRVKPFALNTICGPNRQKRGFFHEAAARRLKSESRTSNRNCQELKTLLSPLPSSKPAVLIAIASGFFHSLRIKNYELRSA